jgi:hypothetical protein
MRELDDALGLTDLAAALKNTATEPEHGGFAV